MCCSRSVGVSRCSGARSREGEMWDLAHKVGGELKIEFPGDGNEAKRDGKGAGNEFEIARMVGEGLRLANNG